MYAKAPSTLLLALFALLLVSVHALPRVLHTHVTPTPTTTLPSASFSMQASSQVPSSMAAPTPQTHPTLHSKSNVPMAEFEDDSTIEATLKTSNPSAAGANSLASTLSFLTSVTRLLSSLTGLLGFA